MKYAQNQLPTQEYLNECFRYDPKTGYLFWKVRPLHHFKTYRGMRAVNGRLGNAIAGCLNEYGYSRLQVNGKGYYSHRVIWCLLTGEFPPEEIDHINHNRNDNRMSNLRLSTHHENQKNQSIRSDNSSGVTGLHWHKRDKIWQVDIKLNGKTTYLGSFSDKAKAIQCRQAANIKYGYHSNHGVK
ncbi:MAG: hypothetical protein ACI9N9_002598 [Enterobacterales bacterium]|jgi:hypothetical protein